MVVSATIVSFYGLLQYLGYDFFRWAEVPFELNRSFSTFGNPVLLGGYLVIILPIALALFISATKPAEIGCYGMWTALYVPYLALDLTPSGWCFPGFKP